MPGTERKARAKSPRRGLQGLALVASSLLVLTGAEVAVRLLVAPAPKPRLRPAEPTTQTPDPVIGWKNRPGDYQIAPYSEAGRPIAMRFLADGRRRAAASPHSGTPLLLVGGSFAQGWAISDEETLAWKLQLRFPELDVQNYGAGGYGTLQSLLLLERELPSRPPGTLVLYAFTGHHTTRNTAPWSWLRMLSRMSVRGHVDVPYATLDGDGRLLRHPPERWVAWPLSERLRGVEFVQTRWAGLQERAGGGRAGQELPVTEALLSEMDALARSHSAQLVVALLSAKRGKTRHFRAFLEEQGIDVIDCNAFPLSRSQIVVGEGHPNGRMNDEWTSCVGDYLSMRFAAELSDSLQGAGG